MAKASQEDVLALWQGLGYYSRARNLHSCAQMVAAEFGGVFPDSFKSLITLKGVGSYTAAAIASFAYNEAVPVIDGNVYRVISRVFGIYDDISNLSTRKVFETQLNLLIPASDPATFNQAIMEFGALQCTPSSPDCVSCIFADQCHAHQHSEVGKLPVKSKKIKVVNRYFNYFVFEHEGQVLMNARKEKDIWLGLHDFFNIEKNNILDEEGAILEASLLLSPEKWELIDISVTYKHILTHRIIYARFFRVGVLDKGDFNALKNTLELKAIKISETEAISKPILITNYFNSVYF